MPNLVACGRFHRYDRPWRGGKRGWSVTVTEVTASRHECVGRSRFRPRVGASFRGIHLLPIFRQGFLIPHGMHSEGRGSEVPPVLLGTRGVHVGLQRPARHRPRECAGVTNTVVEHVFHLYC